MKIGVLGGTGPAGRGIAARLASVGHDVTMGSRDREKSQVVVDELRAQWGERVDGLTAGTNHDAADADLVVLATVWDAAVATAQAHAGQLAGKAVISMANGLVKEGRQFVPVLSPVGSIAAEVQLAAPDARVVAAFHLVPAAALADLDHHLTSDVLVVGEESARAIVLDLVDGIPDLRALDAGGLANALGIETFSAALLTVNLRHKGEGTLRLEGIGPRRTS
ncbi:MAG: 8-hydroxy-5-deazaflavin:NADPH oxidoreductase [Actinomycetota bacterium]|jgi:NADPH-dependent F420 reductase|nr:8-hydroxy-5-deazaflavin:NADPH oxidoreductase [Actinomycetota bacterium]